MAEMRVTLPSEYEVRAPIEVDDPDFGMFRSAVFFTVEEWSNLTQEQRDAKAQARYEEWRERQIYYRDNPSPPVEEPTEEPVDELEG